MKIYLTEENFNTENHTMREIADTFFNHIYVNLKKYDVKEIITNPLIGSVLSDNKNYIAMSNSTIFSVITEPYLYGSVYGIKIFINPMMKWSDTRIIAKYDITTIRRNKLLKVLNKKYIDLLEEIVINEKIGDKLF
jgi:hypothetical protein